MLQLLLSAFCDLGAFAVVAVYLGSVHERDPNGNH
jgi:hypothetical protein